jgi:hypothetical protein
MNMKKISTLTFLFSLGLPLFAQAQVTTPTTDSEIAAQVNTTKDLTDRLLRKLDARETNAKVNVTDYLAFKKDFQQKVETALTKFEGELKSDVLPRVAVYLDRYNTIATSTEYPADQKKLTLDEQKSLINAQMDKISTIYQKDLNELYATVAGVPDHFYLKFTAAKDAPDSGCRFSNELRKDQSITVGKGELYAVSLDGQEYLLHQYCGAIEDKGFSAIHEYPSPSVMRDDASLSFFQFGSEEGGEDLYANVIPLHPFSRKRWERFYRTRLFQEATYPLFRKSCQSQLCFSFVSSELTLFLTGVAQSIDRELVFKLADETTISLKPLLKFAQKYSDYGSEQVVYNFDDSVIFNQLKETEYPADYNTLPYDTGAAQ